MQPKHTPLEERQMAGVDCNAVILLTPALLNVVPPPLLFQQIKAYSRANAPLERQLYIAEGQQQKGAVGCRRAAFTGSCR